MASQGTANGETARAFVAKHLGNTLTACPDVVREALEEKFIDDYNTPYTLQLEAVLRKRLTDDEVRHLLFAPTPQQYRFYADMLSLRDGQQEEDPLSWQCIVRKRFLTLFSLKHARNWPLVVEFMLHDGLQILVDLFLHRDVQLRGQAIDTFVQITSNHVAFDWFEPPVGYEARVLHANMVALASPNASFLSRIVANIRLYGQPDDADSVSVQRLPTGTVVLLQVLAFFLSWVRKFYTQNELQLSRELLDLLRDWKQITQSDNDEELCLAKQVFEDFGRWPAIEEEDEKGEESFSHMSLSDRDMGPRKDVFSRGKIDELLQLADTDDEAAERAVALCSEAIDANLRVVDARLCRARARHHQIQNSKLPSLDDAQLCLRDCAAVLDQEPGNVDAWRCRLGLLETMAMWSQGRELLDAWYSAPTHDAFVSDDIAFLTERRVFFTEKAHEMQRRQADTRRDDAARRAKQQQVYRLLLQRTNGASPPEEPAAATTEIATAGRAASLSSSTATTSSADILARFRSSARVSTTEKKSSADAPLRGVVQTRAFVRRLAKCKHDPAAVRSLLRCGRDQDVVAAIETALPEESLVPVLEALVVSREEEDVVQDTRLLQHLLRLPRFSLMREMASPAKQQRIDTLVARAHAKLGMALGA
jgi:hypothetical protein